MEAKGTLPSDTVKMSKHAGQIPRDEMLYARIHMPCVAFARTESDKRGSAV